MRSGADGELARSVDRENPECPGGRSESVRQLTGVPDDGALLRNGIRGIFREHFVMFDVSRPRVGEKS
jgi:hypothetical protein